MIAITPENILSHEWIGLDVKAIVGKKSMQGKIVDETKQTFTLEEKNGNEKKLVKKETVFEIQLEKKRVQVLGSALVFRSEDRIKMAKRGK